MKEHNLAEISRLFLEMKDLEAKIKETKELSPGLCIIYQVVPFTAATTEGSLGEYDTLEAHAVLGISMDELRVPIMNTIEGILLTKIESIKAMLRRLGVKLHEKIEIKPAKQLRLPAPKIKVVK